MAYGPSALAKTNVLLSVTYACCPSKQSLKSLLYPVQSLPLSDEEAEPRECRNVTWLFQDDAGSQYPVVAESTGSAIMLVGSGVCSIRAQLCNLELGTYPPWAS